MDMDQEAIIAGGASQGDLADVVARAGAMAALPFTSHHQLLLPSSSPAAVDHTSMAPGQDEDRRLAAVMFEAAQSMVDPYLPRSCITAPHGGYWLPPQPLTAAQISHHACGYGRDMVMAGSAAASDVEGDDAMRRSPVTPAAASAHQMMTRLSRSLSLVRRSFTGLVLQCSMRRVLLLISTEKFVCHSAPSIAYLLLHFNYAWLLFHFLFENYQSILEHGSSSSLGF
jgi:hypothetical protein